METIILVIVINIMNILCLFFGVKVGYSVSLGKNIELPKINPVKKIKQELNDFERRKEEEKLKVIMTNIDNYDGTSNGQQEIPT